MSISLWISKSARNKKYHDPVIQLFVFKLFCSAGTYLVICLQSLILFGSDNKIISDKMSKDFNQISVHQTWRINICCPVFLYLRRFVILFFSENGIGRSEFSVICVEIH